MKCHVTIFTLAVLMLIQLACRNSNSKLNINHVIDADADSFSSIDTMNASLDSVFLNLLDFSAKDFSSHQSPVPLGFRNVKFKYLIKTDGEKSYLICGQFLEDSNQNNEKWTHFATIKTDPYEHWIGSNSLQYCQDSKEITNLKIDISVALKNILDSVQNQKKSPLKSKNLKGSKSF